MKRAKNVFGSRRYAGNEPSASVLVDRFDLKLKRLKRNPWLSQPLAGEGPARTESRNGTYHLHRVR